LPKGIRGNFIVFIINTKTWLKEFASDWQQLVIPGTIFFRKRIFVLLKPFFEYINL